MQNEQSANLVRFGPFEVDLRSGELYSNGARIQLQEQPFRILKLLAESPGELVSREQIQQTLWPDGTVVEFDNAVNAAIKKLRIALGDSADEPQYVETVKRRGYRLKVLVEPGRSVSNTTRADARKTHPAVAAVTQHWTRAVAVVLAALVALGAGYLYGRRTPKLTDSDSIVLAEFVNKTGDSVFDGTLRQGLSIQLQQSPFLSLVSEERVQRTLLLMAKPPDSRLTPELAGEVCQRTGGAAVLEGSIASLGSQYVLGLRAQSCRTGNVIDEEQVQAARKEDVLNAMTLIARKFRSRAGEALATVRELDTPLAEATTPSLDALKAYSAARQVTLAAGGSAAVPLLKRAIEIDPHFAIAHATLGLTYSSMGESELAAASTREAYRWRDRASERERFFIAANYDREVTGNLERARQTCTLWARTYPRDPDAPILCSGFISQGTGNFEASIEAAQKGLRLDPDHAFGYVNLAASYLYLNRLNEAAGAVDSAFARKLEVPELLLIRFYIAFLRGDSAGMNAAATQAKGKAGAEDWMLESESLALAHSGKFELAGRLLRRAMEVAQQSGGRERAATYQTGRALWEALAGEAAAAKESATVALQLSHGRDVEYGAALALALSGDSRQSETLAKDLAARFPEDTSAKFTYVPTVRAAIALNHGKPADAIELLETARPYDVAMPGLAFFGFFGAMYPAYVRGEAYLALHRGREAAAEFQKVLDHPGIVLADPAGSLARLQLGRALLLAGDKRAADAAFEAFLTLWREADADIPILKQVRSR